MTELLRVVYQVFMKSGDILDCIESMWVEEMRSVGNWMADNPQGWLNFRTVNGWCMVPVQDIACIKLPEN